LNIRINHANVAMPGSSSIATPATLWGVAKLQLIQFIGRSADKFIQIKEKLYNLTTPQYTINRQPE